MVAKHQNTNAIGFDTEEKVIGKAIQVDPPAITNCEWKLFWIFLNLSNPEHQLSVESIGKKGT